MKRKTGGISIVRFMIIVLAITLSLSFAVSAQALLQIGSQAPDFTLKDIDGKDVSLAQFSQKKAVVIFFWSTWSANSQRGLKRFEEFHKKYRDKGIQILAVNANSQTIPSEEAESIKKFAKDLDISFPILFDRELNTFRGYGIVALPSTVIVAEGKIIYELPGLPLVATEDMFDYLQVLAGEQPRKKVEPKYKPRHDAIADTNLARGFVKKKLYSMAYPLFKKAMEKDAKYMLPYVELAKLYELEGNHADAEEILRKALSAEPDNVVVMSELGYLLTKTGRIGEAVAVLDKAAKLNSYTPSHYYLAYALGKDGKTKDAQEAFEKALALNPFDPTIYTLRGELYENSKMLKESASDYRKALELLLNIEPF